MKGALVFLAAALAAAPVHAQDSPGGTTRAEVSIAGGAVRYPESNRWEARITGRDGTLRYVLSREVPFDVQFPSVRVEDEGWCVVASGNEGWVEWYDANGSLVRSWRPFASPVPEYERVLKTAVGSGRTGVLLSEPGSGASRAVLTDAAGEILWTHALPYPHAGEISLAADGRFLLAGSYDTSVPPRTATVLLDAAGVEVWTREGMFRHADVDAVQGRVALGDRSGVTILPAAPGGSAAVWRTGSPAEVVSAVRWAGERLAVAAEEVSVGEEGPRYVSTSLVILDRAGRELERRTVRVSSAAPATLHPADGGVELRSGAGRSLRVPIPR